MIIYQNYASEMLSKIGRVSKMIKHSPSIGSYHESIVKCYLRNFLSKRYSIKTGFVRNIENGEVSHQMDILIVDENIPSAYQFQDGEFAIVSPRAVVCALEIKTEFNKKELNDIAKKSEQYRKVNPVSLNIYALCFKSASQSYQTIANWFKSVEVKDNFLSYPFTITVLDKCILHFLPPQLMTPQGAAILQCKPEIENKEEAYLTYLLFNIMKSCELKEGIHSMETINSLFDQDIERYFLIFPYGFQYKTGSTTINKIKGLS